VGKIVSDRNRLTIVHPELIKEWHPIKNLPLLPDEVSYGVAKKVWWQCSNKKCGYEWTASLNLRSKGRGCPKCYLPSKIEMLLLSELEYVFGKDNVIHQYPCLKYKIDIKLKKHPIAIEFDGHYHIGKDENDKKRRERIQKENLILYVIRDNYLNLLSEKDIKYINKERIVKEDIDNLLKLILTTYNGFNINELKNLNDYFNNKSFNNLDQYYKYVFR
jgi:very-short-patch-repair endonuclease